MREWLRAGSAVVKALAGGVEKGIRLLVVVGERSSPDHASLVAGSTKSRPWSSDGLATPRGPLAREAAWDFVVGTLIADDVVIRDAAVLGHHERLGEIVGALAEDQLARVGEPALARRLAAERFVRRVVVASEKVPKPMAQRSAAGVDVGRSVETTEHGVLRGLIELLNLPMPSG